MWWVNKRYVVLHIISGTWYRHKGVFHLVSKQLLPGCCLRGAVAYISNREKYLFGSWGFDRGRFQERRGAGTEGGETTTISLLQMLCVCVKTDRQIDRQTDITSCGE